MATHVGQGDTQVDEGQRAARSDRQRRCGEAKGLLLVAGALFVACLRQLGSNPEVARIALLGAAQQLEALLLEARETQRIGEHEHAARRLPVCLRPAGQAP
jgi:hypothetical protein